VRSTNDALDVVVECHTGNQFSELLGALNPRHFLATEGASALSRPQQPHGLRRSFRVATLSWLRR
jgi:hypothetical protein